MKRISTLCLVALCCSLAASGPPVQGASRPGTKTALPAQVPLAPAPGESASWFLMESRTQWLLVIQQGVAGFSGAQPLDSDSSTPNTPAPARKNGTSPRRALQPGARGPEGTPLTGPDGSSKTTIILEGNTLDIPIEPGVPPVKPSAPSS